jgi:hypothetical protein
LNLLAFLSAVFPSFSLKFNLFAAVGVPFAMTLTKQQRCTIVGQIWSPKTLEASIPACEAKVAHERSRILQIEESVPPQIVALASACEHGGLLIQLANARIKAGDETAWPLVRLGLWFGTLGLIANERMYWFNRHRQAFEWERYDYHYVHGLWMLLAACYWGDTEIVHRLVPVLTRMMRLPQCLSTPADEPYRDKCEEKYNLARFVGKVLKLRAGIQVNELLRAGSADQPGPLDRWFECGENEAAQRATLDLVLDWHLNECGGYAKKGRCGVVGGVLNMLTPWEVFAITLDRYDWLREVEHPYAKIMLFPPRTVPLEKDNDLDMLTRFAERVLRETEMYVKEIPSV